MKLIPKILVTGFIALIMAFMYNTHVAYAQDNTVFDVVNSNEDVSIFADLLEEMQLPDLLKEEGPFTVLAPTDEAFQKSGVDPRQLKLNPRELENLVINHLYRGQLWSAEIGPNTGISVKNGDVEASNGIVHVVDELFRRQQ